MIFEYKLFRGGLETAQAFLAEHGASGWRCHSFEPCPPTFEVVVLLERTLDPAPSHEPLHIDEAEAFGLAMKS